MFPLNEVEIAQKFHGAVEAIASSFISAYALRFKQDVEHLSSPLLRWLDFRFRYVDPQPREVVFSNKFPKEGLPRNTDNGFKHLVSLIEKGKDINPYQGRGLILRHDSSGPKKGARTDLLWADWSILHFHLTAEAIPNDQFFSKPADYLAFCIVGADMVAFIDVLPHPPVSGFSNPGLMETIHENWPQYLERFELKGIVASSEELSIEDIHTLRANGVSYCHTHGGKAYMGPGMGITTASTSTKISLAYNHVSRYIQELAKIVCEPDSQFQAETGRLGIGMPNFTLALTPRGLAVYEETSKCTFLLSHPTSDGKGTFLNELCNLVAPRWAVEFLLSSASHQA